MEIQYYKKQNLPEEMLAADIMAIHEDTLPPEHAFCAGCLSRDYELSQLIDRYGHLMREYPGLSDSREPTA